MQYMSASFSGYESVCAFSSRHILAQAGKSLDPVALAA